MDDVFLTTPRLLLRRYSMSDVDNLVGLDADPEVMRYLNGGRPTPRERIELYSLPRWLADYARFDGLGRFAVHDLATGTFLGRVALEPDEEPPHDLELGWRFRREAWGHGYATESAHALLRVAFVDRGVTRVFARTMAVNLRSRRVMERLGMRYARTIYPEFEEPIEGAEAGDVEYELLRADWSARSVDSTTSTS